ncbi:MAG TPA: large conductance mechanosensitive channel protein MscL [Burkholderiaceae bacterium]|nr:large conductance mechanosensitive channel protein MscL [Burkholderiaceae bacterium]
MSMLSEFKEFALKGNVMDLAVGVIIGAAFGKIVDSLVGDMIMPIVAALLGGRVDFSSLLIPLGEVPPGTTMSLEGLRAAGVPILAYGNFVTIVINFILLAFVIFMLVKALNYWRRQPDPAPEAAPAPTEDQKLLGEIRDLLKAGR